MTEQVKNKNEFCENGSLYIREIKRCRCIRKKYDEYIISCKVHQRGEDNYHFRRGDGWISNYNGRKLWLDADALNTVLKAIDAFDAEVESAQTIDFDMLNLMDTDIVIYYRPAEDNKNVDINGKFDFILRYRDQDQDSDSEEKKIITQRLGDTAWWGILNELEGMDRRYVCGEKNRRLIQKPTAETISQHPLTAAAEKAGLVQLEKIVRLYYHLADKEDCRILAEMTGRRILPALPEEYNRYYTVDAANMTDDDYELLEISGYELLHRPYFAMKGHTHGKITLNPHTKYGSDAAREEEPAITFNEFLKLFGHE